MSDTRGPTARPTVRRTRVGAVPVGPDRLLVEVVQRSWTTERASRSDCDPTSIHTDAPAGVQVRREPDTDQDAPGGMTPRAARALAKLLTKAAAHAETTGPAGTDDARRR